MNPPPSPPEPLEEQARLLCLEMALALHAEVRRAAQAQDAAGHTGTAASGDITFRVDELVEASISEHLLRLAQRFSALGSVAYYSEDRGLVAISGAETQLRWVLVIDPIDGTRPALCGFESCCVSVAAARVPPAGVTGLSFSDLVAGCLVEIQSGRSWSAHLGNGRVWCDNCPWSPPPRAGSSGPQPLFLAWENCGRPMQASAWVLGPLLDEVGLGGASFVFNSSSFALLQVVRGRLGAYIDFYGALLHSPAQAQAEAWRATSEAVFAGKLFGLFPYDIAAAWVLLQAVGCPITDAWGQPLDARPLLATGPSAIISCLAAAAHPLHARLRNEIGGRLQSCIPAHQ